MTTLIYFSSLLISKFKNTLTGILCLKFKIRSKPRCPSGLGVGLKFQCADARMGSNPILGNNF